MATHSSILAWEIPWTEEPGRLQSMGSQLDMTEQLTHTHIHRIQVAHNTCTKKEGRDFYKVTQLLSHRGRSQISVSRVFLTAVPHSSVLDIKVGISTFHLIMSSLYWSSSFHGSVNI